MFLLPLLEALDRKRVEPFAYSNVEMPDVVTDQVRRSVNWWRECCNLSDDELATQIRADAIDVLVDLTGHTARNRLEVFARKPAPVQISWLGYPVYLSFRFPLSLHTVEEMLALRGITVSHDTVRQRGLEFGQKIANRILYGVTSGRAWSASAARRAEALAGPP